LAGRAPPARNPMRQTLPDCCARAANGQAVAPPTSVMKLRRLMKHLSADNLPYHIVGTGDALCVTAKSDSECPLWVISGHRGRSASCPLCPQKRTSVECSGMSERSNFLIAASMIRHRCGSQSKIGVSERVPSRAFGELQVADVGSESQADP